MKSKQEKKALDRNALKRTSIGLYHRPKNKHKRKNFKPYVGQGR